MRFSTSFRRRLQLLNLPGALLLLLLQRTPVLRLLVSTEPVVVAAPAGAMLNPPSPVSWVSARSTRARVRPNS